MSSLGFNKKSGGSPPRATSNGGKAKPGSSPKRNASPASSASKQQQQQQNLSTSRSKAAVDESHPLWEREKNSLLKLSSEQLMRSALKMHFEILDLRQGAAYLSDQANMLSDAMTTIDFRSVSPSVIESPPPKTSSSQHNSPEQAARAKRFVSQVTEAIRQLSSLQRAIEGGLSVIGPVSPRRVPQLLIEGESPSDEAPVEKRLDYSVVAISQAVHHLLAQAFVLAESVSEAQVAVQSSPGRAAEYMALRAAVTAGEKEIEAENSRSSRLQKQLDAMDDTVKCLRAARGDLEDSVSVSVSSLRQREESLQEEKAQLQIRLQTVEMQRDRALDDASIYREESEQLKDRVAELQQAVAKLESESQMNKILYDNQKAESDALLDSMNTSDSNTAAAVTVLRQQLQDAVNQAEAYRQQLATVQAEGPLVHEEDLLTQQAMADAEVVEMEERLELEEAYFERLMDMRLRFQRNVMQLQINGAILKQQELANQIASAQQSHMDDLARDNVGMSVGDREESARQARLLDIHDEVSTTLRDMTFTALRDLDASYTTIANQNDKMEMMQSRIEQLEYDKHDTKELRGMLDTAQKAFGTADSEAAKLLEYLGQARDEVARLTEENKRIVDETNARAAEMDETTKKAQQNEAEAIEELKKKIEQHTRDYNEVKQRRDELETLVEELEQKLTTMINSLEEKLKNAFAEKDDLEKKLERATEDLKERARESEQLSDNLKAALAKSHQDVLAFVQSEEANGRTAVELECDADVREAVTSAAGQRSAQELAEKLRDATARSTDGEKTSAELKDQLAESQKRAEEAERTVAELRDKLAEADKKIDATEQALADLRDQLAASQQRAEAAENTAQELSAKLADVEKKTDAEGKSALELHAQLSEAEQKLDASDKKVQELSEQLDQANKKVSDLEKEMAEREKAAAFFHDSLTKEQADKLESALKAARADLDKAKLEATKRELELQDELTTSKLASDGKIKTLTADLEQRTKERDDAEERVQSLQQQLDASSRSTSVTGQELQDARKKLDETEKALKEALELSAQREKERDDAQAQVQSLLQQLDASSQSTSEQLQDARKKLDETEKALKEAREAAAQREKELQDEIAKLTEQSEAEIKKALADLEKEREANKQLRDEASSSESGLTAKLRQLESDLDREKAASSRSQEGFEGDKSKLEKELDQLRQQLSQGRVDAMKKDADAEKQIADLNQQLERLAAKLKAEQEAGEAREKDLISEQGKLNAALKTERQAVSDLRDQSMASDSDTKKRLSELQCEIVDVQTRLDAMTDERNALKNQVEQLVQEKSKLAQELAEAQQHGADADASNAKLTAQLAKVTASRDRLKGALKDAVALQDQLSKVSEIQEANTRLGLENARLESALEELRAAAADADKQVMLSKHEFAKLERAVQNISSADADLSHLLASQQASASSSSSSPTAASVSPQALSPDSQQAASPPSSSSPAANNINNNNTAGTASASQHAEIVTRAADTMASAMAAIKHLHANGDTTCSSVTGLMKLVDSLHHQLNLPQPLLMAPTPVNTARGIDSVNGVFPAVMGKVRELIHRAAAQQQPTGEVVPLMPADRFQLQEENARGGVNMQQADEWNDLLEDALDDLSDVTAREGVKVRRAMDLLEEATGAMRGRVGSEKLISALDLLKRTPGAQKGAAMAGVQQRARRGAMKGTVIININELDPKYRSIAWLVSTRGALVDHLGDCFRALVAQPFHLEKTQRTMGTLLGTFLTHVEKMHIGLPPHLLSMEVVKVREATDKELSRILLHSSAAAEQPPAADSPDCSPVRAYHQNDHSSITNYNNNNNNRSDTSMARAVVAMHEMSTMTEENQFTPPRQASRTVVASWGSPPPPPAFGTFF